MPIWGAMLETYNKLTTKPTNIPDLKDTLQIIWNDFTRDHSEVFSWISKISEHFA
jgi:hypothetical protein